MAHGYYGGWGDYVSVAERRKKAMREIEKLRKKGRPIAPVSVEGRTIAKTFWGKAWCDNLESYRDYESRLPRGRSYVRNGLVIDLQIAALEIKAMVCGSSVYKVTATIEALAAMPWRSICEDCTGGIDSLVELLQGRFSKGVMERICRQDRGLFPKPSEIRLSCTCPDGAYMCKHVVAALYGVGARLDDRPELLFRLRAVNENDLVADIDKALPLSNRPLDVGKVLESEDISALFDVDMEVTQSRTGMAPSSAVPSPPQAERQSTQRRPGKTSKVRKSGASTKPTSPGGHRKPRTVSKPASGTKKRKPSKPKIELTPDGFVKWWK